MELMVLQEDVFEKSKEGVYLIRNLNNGLLKIGKTNNLKRRFNEIENTFKFCGIEPNIKVEAFINYYDDTTLESYLHKKFKEKKVKNEWFDIKNKDIVLKSLVNFNKTKSKTVKSYKNSYLSLNDLTVWAYLSQKRKKIYNFNEIFYTMNDKYEVIIEGYVPTLYDLDVILALIDSKSSNYTYRGISAKLKLVSFGNTTKKRIQKTLINICDTKVIIKNDNGNIVRSFNIVDSLDLDKKVICFDKEYEKILKVYLQSNNTFDKYVELKYSAAKKIFMFLLKYKNKNTIINKKMLYKFTNEGKKLRNSRLIECFEDMINANIIDKYEVFDTYIKVSRK